MEQAWGQVLNLSILAHDASVLLKGKGDSVTHGGFCLKDISACQEQYLDQLQHPKLTSGFTAIFYAHGRIQLDVGESKRLEVKVADAPTVEAIMEANDIAKHSDEWNYWYTRLDIGRGTLIREYGLRQEYVSRLGIRPGLANFAEELTMGSFLLSTTDSRPPKDRTPLWSLHDVPVQASSPKRAKSKPGLRSEGPVCSAVGAQADHLDAVLREALLALGHIGSADAHVGILQGSAPFVQAQREFVEAVHTRFLVELAAETSPHDDNKLLLAAMPGTSVAEKTAKVWDLVCREYLPRFRPFVLTHKQPKTVYMKIPRYYFALMTADVVHFGARFPLKGAGTDRQQSFRSHLYAAKSADIEIKGDSVLVTKQDIQFRTVALHEHDSMHPVLQYLGLDPNASGKRVPAF